MKYYANLSMFGILTVSDTYILLDGLVYSILGYFYESRSKIQQTSKNIPGYYTLNRSVRDLIFNSKGIKKNAVKYNENAWHANVTNNVTPMQVEFSRALCKGFVYCSEMKTCQIGLFVNHFFQVFFGVSKHLLRTENRDGMTDGWGLW